MEKRDRRSPSVEGDRRSPSGGKPEAKKARTKDFASGQGLEPSSIHLSAKDTRDTRDLPESSSSSSNYSDQGWQGTSVHTFEALLRKVVQDFKVENYEKRKTLKKSIYDICVRSSKILHVDENEDKEYIKYLDSNLNKVFNNNKEIEENLRFKTKNGYRHFIHRVGTQPKEMRRRFSLNIYPNKIPEVGPEILRETALFPYVYDIKIAEKKSTAERKLDNIIVFFYESEDGENKNDLLRVLLKYQQYTRLGHPAMLEPLDPKIQGIAFAHQAIATREGEGWGKTRIRHIADCMWKFKQGGEEITFEKLLPEVQRRFRENSIDPNNPYRDLEGVS